MNLERLATRDLSPEEARKLAQEALDNEDLFDALVAQGAMESSLASPAVQAGLSRPARRAPWVIGLVAIAAALLVGVFVWRSGSRTMVHPLLASGEGTSGEDQPILLASDLAPLPVAGTAFRGGGEETREPRSNGMIIAIDGWQATINLGAIDGVEQGAKLGPITITTVFRDHARGDVAPGARARVNQSVQIPPAMHMAAVVHEVDALAGAGNLNAARSLARKSAAGGSAGEIRPLLERLGALDYRAGAIAAAFDDYKAAVRNFSAAPAASAAEQAATLNSLGVLYLLRGDLPEAAATLRRAAELADNGQIEDNLGVLAQMRGDTAQARENYRRAVEQSSGRDRTTAQSNLARLAK